MRNSHRHAPLILRVAGLPAETMVPFSHPLLVDAIVERERLGAQLDQMRAALVDCLHQAVHGAAREERRFLLAIKRRCFNGENLTTHRMDPRWPLLGKISSTLIDEIVAREAAISALDVTWDEQYHCAVRQERESLAQLAKNRSFIRGVTLASPVVAQNLDRLNVKEIDGYGKREKKLCLTLLRYASRSALKLSPFATLTRTAIARATQEEAAGFAFLPGDPWQERSTVSLHRELLSQYTCLLLRCHQFIEDLPVTVNETLSAEGDEGYRFFRPSRWVFDDDSRTFCKEEASFVRVKLESPLIPWLLSQLRDGSRTCREVLAGLKIELAIDDRDALAQSLTELLDADFLNLVVPWDTSAPALEQQILYHLDQLSPDSDLGAFREGLRTLARFLSGYAKTNSPVRFLEDCKRLVEDLFHTLVTPAILPSQIEFNALANTFEEDVFLQPDPDRTGGDEIAQLSWSRMQALLEDLDPLVRFANLYSSRHDLLHALAAFGNRLWPNVEDVDFLEFFSSAHSLFEEYIRHRRFQQPVFNPLELESVSELVRWRQRIDSELTACFDQGDHDQGQKLCPRALTALLDQAPTNYVYQRDFCAFVQPLDSEGRTWVVNSNGEGYGRFGGRFTAGMGLEPQRRWASYFTPLSILDLNGERVELIDMSCPGTRTINVHIPQTYRVLKMPGEHSDHPTERVLRLRDLRVRLRGADRFPVLTDSEGQRLFPIQLGSSAAGHRPTILKFLAAFGQGDLQRWPVRPPLLEDGVSIVDRHQIGSTVYLRRRWAVAVQPLFTQIDARREERAFVDINSWRLAKGIPDRVFALERVVAFRRKPQYIDFSSPSFVHIFQSMLKADTRALELEEVLPAPTQFPSHCGDWAVEVQLESFCFRDRGPGLPRSVRGEPETARSAGAI